MATIYNRKRYRVQHADVDLIAVAGSTVLASGNVNGGFEITVRADNFGCGNPSSVFAIQFKDPVPWKKIDFDFRMLGSAGCWNINDGAGGNWASPLAVPPFTSPFMNLLTYNEAINKDRVYNTYKFYQDGEYVDPSIISRYKVSRCDGLVPASPFDSNTSEYRGGKFILTRNSPNQLAGLHFARSCTQTGPTALTVVKDIYLIH
jgi:hypothetical protein